MRYLLNAVAADGTRFRDLKERFTFFGTNTPDPIALEDWKARGITPIYYDANGDHESLLATLERWSELSANSGKQGVVDAELRRIVKVPMASAPEHDRDLLEHFFRRSNPSERRRLSALVARAKADAGWLSAIAKVVAEREQAHP